MTSSRPHLAFALGAFVLASAPAFAQTTQTISTNSLAYGVWDSVSDSLGPWPSGNFGVQASVSLATDIAAGVRGSTSFSLPTISAGDVFHANTSTLNYAYNANWTDATIGSHTALSAGASFNYDLGPFSGSRSIYDQALNATSNGNLGTGATLGAGNANATAYGDKYGANYTLSAYVASASVGVNVGLNLQNAISYTPTVTYGYYTWTNTTGLLTSADHPTFVGVTSGALGYLFPNNIASSVGSNNFYLNFMPAVRMDLTINGASTVTVPLEGTFSAHAFGATLIDATLPLGNLYSDTRNLSTWEDDVEWNNGDYYSMKLHQDNLDCQIHPSNSCATYTVEAQPTLLSQSLLPQDTTHNYIGTTTGGFDPGLSNAPDLPPICDPQTGRCWQSNDPNAPIGPGTVTFQVSSVPEPESWAAMLLGLGLLGATVNRRTRRGRPRV